MKAINYQKVKIEKTLLLFQVQQNRDEINTKGKTNTLCRRRQQ